MPQCTVKAPALMSDAIVFGTVVVMPIVIVSSSRLLALHHDNGFHLVKHRPTSKLPRSFDSQTPKLTHDRGQESSSNTRLTISKI